MISANDEILVSKAAELIAARNSIDALIERVRERKKPHSIVIEHDSGTCEEAVDIPPDIIVLGLHRMAEEATRQAAVAIATIKATRADHG